MINGEMLKQAIISGAHNISAQKNHINDLNIFPVPDGDTGTNMSMTVMAAAKALEDCDSTNAGEVAQLAAKAMLRGARGNSGVITSILFRGFGQGLKDMEEVNGKNIAAALGIGVDAAYKAVTKPAEGTILTVARMAYEAGVEASKENHNALYVWQTIVNKANDALALTPELLPVLKKAGVVDAGGKGLCTIFEGMLTFFRDGEVIPYEETTAPTVDTFESAAAEFDDDIEFTYCTEIIVGRDTECTLDPDDLRTYLQTIGDCVVVVNDEEIIKVHVHTETPNVVLEQGLTYGQLLAVKVENMKEQHKNAKKASKKSKKAKKEKFEFAEPTEDIGFVAVAAGEGMKNLFKELGCVNVVSGGQNPSTDDIYEAVLATPAKNVIVLPNNKNIILAAEQTVPMVNDRNVIIVPTRTIPQGMTALLNFDPEISADSNAQLMMDAARNVGTGLVTFAARNSEFGGKKIKEGDIIALENGKLTITEKSAVKALVKLAKSMVTRDTSFITLIYGEDIEEEDAQKAFDELQDKFGSRADISLVKGDQPVYYFILSIE